MGILENVLEDFVMRNDCTPCSHVSTPSLWVPAIGKGLDAHVHKVIAS